MENIQIVKGPISQNTLMEIISDVSGNKPDGAINVFIGQVRADETDGKHVTAIEYEVHQSMAVKELNNLLNFITNKYKLNRMVVIHSEGLVPAGKWSLLVVSTAPHRQQAILATKEFIDLMKKHVPIWKKELFDDGSHQWV
ncbi:MAG: molybdenum cofactor biosynthesis protein MoaE [Chlorobi bacterium]|nr:molybdenum cofactor biosynthesis protein MoaE [Chlorobiota bacterium]